MSVSDIHNSVVKPVNPNYGAYGTKANCRRATFAYELRRRGNDVIATRTTYGSGQASAGFHAAITPGAKGSTNLVVNGYKLKWDRARLEKDPTYTSDLLNATKGISGGAHNKIPKATPKGIFDELAKQPERSRGELVTKWAIHGGHSMAYEIINHKPVVFDNQSGKEFETPSQFAAALPQAASAGFTRLDNLDLNKEHLLKWVRPNPIKS
jgi:hypothetical protein